MELTRQDGDNVVLLTEFHFSYVEGVFGFGRDSSQTRALKGFAHTAHFDMPGSLSFNRERLNTWTFGLKSSKRTRWT